MAWVVSPERQTAKMKGELEDVKALSALPGIKAKVRDSRVDYFGYEPGYVLLNGLNYWCRPMPITFAAANERLESANEAFYRNPQTAPEFVICVVGSVDGRADPQDDALALRALLDNYHPVLVEQRQVLLQKNPARPGWIMLRRPCLPNAPFAWGRESHSLRGRMTWFGWKWTSNIRWPAGCFRFVSNRPLVTSPATSWRRGQKFEHPICQLNGRRWVLDKPFH